MSKLKMINSQKMYSLNAFLVAVCSNLIDSCIVNLEQFILSKSKKNDEFQEMYTNSFNNFEANVRKSREEYKIFMSLNKNKNDKKENIKNNITSLKDKTTTKLYNDDIIDNCKSQKTSQQSSVGDIKYTPSSSSDQGGGSCHKNYKNNQNDDIDDDDIIKVTVKSSDDSQFKLSTNKIHNKKKNQHAKLRRRRRQKIIQSDDDDDNNSSFDSDSELDTDFSSDDDDDYDGDNNDYDDNESDLSSNFESDFSDIENFNDDDNNDENHENITEKNKNEKLCNQQKQDNSEPITNYSDNEDMIIEEEHIIYPNDPDSVNKFIEHFNNLNIVNDLNFKNENSDDEHFMNSSRISIDRPSSSTQNQIDIQIINDDDKNEGSLVKQEPPIKLKYKNRYSKIDPNIIIDFAKTENTIRALKILFDWLRINSEILIGCYHTNPEFIHKIMKLLNYCNIDIFTRKVYFERDFIKVSNVREKLDDLFAIRSTIPLSEDMILKGFDLLKQTQSTLDWETPIRDKITENEENFMRIFKMVDFGFFICKLKKFNYNFCSKSRRFTENLNIKKKHDKKKLIISRKRDRKLSTSSRSRNNKNNLRQRSYNDHYNGGGDHKSSRDREGRGRQGHRNNESKNLTQESNEHKNLEVDNNCVITSVAPRKGYLRNRNSTSNISAVEKMHQQFHCSSDEEKKKQQQNEEQQKNNDTEEKCRLMGRLWLKNEVETLEAKLKQKPIHVVLTPFIVVDAKALTEFTGIVKALVKSKQFIVLIPNAVLGELDQLKKQSDCARNAIRWLEQEFKVGNRHMRAQRDHESQTLLLIKIPKKLDRESSIFIQIAKFCNFIVANHSEGSDYEANLVTFLSGDHLNDKKSTNLSFTGILDAIPVRHDQISNFYEKFKKK